MAKNKLSAKQDPNSFKYSEDDQKIADGPTRDRKLTDFIFCVFMLAFWGFCGYVIYYGYKNGDPIRLTEVYDVDQIPCGSTEYGTEKYTKAYFYQPMNSFGEIVCVSECPTWAKDGIRKTKLDCYGEGTKKSGFSGCEYTGDFGFDKLPEQFLDFATEDFLIYNTTEILGKFCMISMSDVQASAEGWS